MISSAVAPSASLGAQQASSCRLRSNFHASRLSPVHCIINNNDEVLYLFEQQLKHSFNILETHHSIHPPRNQEGVGTETISWRKRQRLLPLQFQPTTPPASYGITIERDSEVKESSDSHRDIRLIFLSIPTFLSIRPGGACRNHVESHKKRQECYEGILDRAGQGPEWYGYCASLERALLTLNSD